MILNTVNNLETLDELYDCSAFTVVGAGGPLDEWMNGINKSLKERGIGTVEEFYTFNGSQMNKRYHLTGNNAYNNDLTFLAFKLDGLNISKLAMFKLDFGARWFDDIVDNNAHRELPNTEEE